MKVRIPTPLRSYTGQQKVVDGRRATRSARCSTISTASYPGIRFRMVDEQDRIRKHMKVFVNDEAVRDLAAPVGADDEVTIMQALSGGAH